VAKVKTIVFDFYIFFNKIDYHEEIFIPPDKIMLI